MVLVDFARGVRVNLAGGNAPPRIRRASSLGLQATLSNRLYPTEVDHTRGSDGPHLDESQKA